MIAFERPEAFLLGAVVLALLWRRRPAARLASALRVLLLLLLLTVLAGPMREDHTPGRDLVLLLDRSRSVPASAGDPVAEVLELVRPHVRPGDRIGFVTFARDAHVQQAPVESYGHVADVALEDRDGTDLAGAIETAVGLIPPGRQGGVLLISDGEATGRGVRAAARHALRRGIRIDALPLRREGAFDLAIDDIALPQDVAVGEPFQGSVWVRADREVTAPFTLRRDGRVLAQGERSFRRGLNRIRFQDRLIAAGVHYYDVGIEVPEDRVAQNNHARAATRVRGPFRVLCITPEGRTDRLTESLRAASIDLTVRAPGNAPLTLDALDGYRAVILEDVPLAALPVGAADALAAYVRELGGGLLMTGGRSSFGPGGYYRSPIEDVLPVSMEIREEERKFALSMAIALDRSGSMSIPVGGGRTKMDLANLGAVAAVELLGRQDMVSVIAVDSSAHVVVPLKRVDRRAEIIADIRSIESMGGGIFTYTALRAAAAELRGSQHGTRHIVLFADANDAEEPGDYASFVPALRAAGVTVSVIGLGAVTDTDAAFLQDVAARGGGRSFFCKDPADLPRMFAQETIQVARSSLVEEPTSVGVLPDIVAVGALERGRFPAVGGYSIAYLKSGASQGLVTRDDTRAPLLAFHHVGLGRSAAYLGIADGDLAGEVRTWDGYGDFFTTLVRWLAGTDASGDVFAEVRREGHEAVLSVEVEEGREALLGGIQVRMLAPDGSAQTLLLTRAGDQRLEVRVPLPREGVYRPALRTADGRVLRLPAVTLPYSPEFEPRADPDAGIDTLRDVVRIAGGRLDPTAEQIAAGPRRSAGSTSLARPLVWVALVIFLLEILVRRLRPRLPSLAPMSRAVAGARAAFARPLKARRAGQPKRAAGRPDEVADPLASEAPEAPPSPDAPADDLRSVLERAKRRRR